MKLKYFYITIEGTDFNDHYKYLQSDFNFQSSYFSNYFQRIFKNEFEVDGFNFLDIRGRLKPKENFEIDKKFKTFEVEIPFDLEKYRKIYPYKNDYPLEDRLLIPIEKQVEFGLFIYDMIIQGLKKSKYQNAPLPVDNLISIANDFRNNGFLNEWIYKTKIFKETDIKAALLCFLNCNYFSLTLIIWKNKKECLRKEILRTLPDSIMYNTKFNDIIIEDNVLKITKKFSGYLFEIPLSELDRIV